MTRTHDVEVDRQSAQALGLILRNKQSIAGDVNLAMDKNPPEERYGTQILSREPSPSTSSRIPIPETSTPLRPSTPIIPGKSIPRNHIT